MTMAIERHKGQTYNIMKDLGAQKQQQGCNKYTDYMLGK